MAQIKSDTGFVKDRIRDLCDGEGAVFSTGNDIDDNDYDYYENEYFDEMGTSVSEDDRLEQGAPGKYTFHQLASKMTNIIPNGLVKKRVVKEGHGQPIPEGSRVEIHYNGFWEGENISFDSSYLRDDPKKFIIGEGEVLIGLEEAVRSMVEGEEAQFLISYKLLFGERGCPPRVKPKANGLFNVELLKVIEHYNLTNMDKMDGTPVPFEEAYKCAISLHQNAVEQFSKRHIHAATNFFHQAVDVLRNQFAVTENDLPRKLALLVKLYSNLAVCYNKENKPRKVCLICKEIEKITDINTHSKALYQFGTALKKLGDYDKAREVLEKALTLKPHDLDVQARLEELKVIDAKHRKDEKDICQKIFGVKIKPEPKIEVSECFQKQAKETLDFFKIAKMKQLGLDMELSENEVAYLEIAVKEYNFELREKQPGKYMLLKK